MTDEMQVGSEGPEVEAWQLFLNTFVDAGVLIEICRLKVDGKFGRTTRIATLAYQIREMILLSPNNGGDGAGVVGPLTQNHALKHGFIPFIVEEPPTEPELEQENPAPGGTEAVRPIAPKAR